MSVPIIVDEWLFEDLAGKNGADKQSQAVQFLYKLEEICDRIVVLEGSPFEKKMHDLMGSTNDSCRFRAARSVFIELISSNSLKKCFIAKEDISALPDDVIKLIHKINPSSTKDHYLFQAHQKLKHKDCFILTSDGRWENEKLKKKGFRIVMKDSFITQYLEREISN
ncbi:MAG: hypothetical protein WCI76_00195 [bacterium]